MRTMTQLIGARVEDQLDRVLWDLVRGDVELHQLTPALAGTYNLGFADGRASLEPALEQARRDAARYYELAYNPGRQLSELRQRRIDEQLETAWRAGELVTEMDVIETVISAAQPRGPHA